MFSRDGFFARRRSKKRFKLLRAIDGKVRQILRPDERVFFATTGTTLSLSEQFFVGWMAMYLNRRALVFTTERILLLQVDRHFRPHGLVSQMPLPAIASVKSTLSGACRVKLLNHEVVKFQSVPTADRKLVTDLLGDLTQGTNAPFARELGMQHLCPHCFAVVPGQPPACPKCGGGFKSIKKATVLSLILPGMGDWYLGHRAFAAMEMIGSAFLWLALVVLPLLTMNLPESEPVTTEDWITAAVILGFGHAMDAWMTRHFAQKGHHPENLPRASGVR
jgi:hypothetical protein